MVSARTAYFKNVSQAVIDASQNDTLNTLINQLASKAEQADLTSGLANKADSSAVTYALSSKADASAVTSLSADLASEVSAREGAVSDLSVAVDAKLDTKAGVGAVQDKFNQVNGVIATKLASSVYDARIVNEAVFFDSVKNSLFLADASGNEIDYVTLGPVSQ